MFSLSYYRTVAQVVRHSITNKCRSVNSSLLRRANNAKCVSNNVNSVSRYSQRCHQLVQLCGAGSCISLQQRLHSALDSWEDRGERLHSDEQQRSNNRGRTSWNLTYSSLVALALFGTKTEGEEEPRESELITMIKRGILAIKVRHNKRNYDSFALN